MLSPRNVALALLAMPFVAALPSASSDVSGAADGLFSFESWAGALARGKPTLSVEEAIAAAGHLQDPSTVERSLEKRLRCNHLSKPPAWGPDAVECINYLARSGLTCRVETVVSMCIIGGAQIFASKVNTRQAYTESSCEHVARAAGAIMDSCYRSDDTVQGDHYAYGNGDMVVTLTSPQSLP
ncbi:hypothetical protein F5X68DRAFT_250916 [Plectosphaerella plurivora]|uniref:Uncharacterized protein n=1 Tax=Plectosphaerella plurivora TaxID=936078 RepID=A0A9P8VJ88_9PEZI|nr:hypothetical protein F5X68DRAFT_250916 [Plectosphaerella plurivora]